jgi:cytochrome bd-type quinol oxidase subunit 2
VAVGPSRGTALTVGVMGEVLLGGTLLILRTGQNAAAGAAFGAAATSIVVGAAMVLVAVAIVGLAVPARLARWFRLAIVIGTSFAAAGVGVLALVSLFGARDGTDSGVGLLLGLGWLCMTYLTVGITRAQVRSNGN